VLTRHAEACATAAAAFFIVLAHEDQDEFNEIVDCLTAEDQPANPHHASLVDQFAIAHWQLAAATFNPADVDARIVCGVPRTQNRQADSERCQSRVPDRRTLRSQRHEHAHAEPPANAARTKQTAPPPEQAAKPSLRSQMPENLALFL
jgi:hypothetical protein